MDNDEAWEILELLNGLRQIMRSLARMDSEDSPIRRKALEDFRAQTEALEKAGGPQAIMEAAEVLMKASP